MPKDSGISLDGRSADLSGLRLEAVSIGRITDCDQGRPKVALPGNPRAAAAPARSTVTIGADDIGRDVVVAFEEGDPARPVILGKVVAQAAPCGDGGGAPERVEIAGEKELTIRCGKASITLTPSGKIILRGTYISTRSSGMVRIKGGSVQIN